MPPVLAIVGRPNVGKSTLFNRLLGQRQALVDDRPGVTRDRNYGVMVDRDREIVLIDTGGFEPEPDDDLFEHVRDQAESAIDEADVILFVVDRQAGLTPADRLAADILRKRAGEKAGQVILVVNKCDGHQHDVEATEFWELGFDKLYTVSAEHGRGVYEIMDAVHEKLPAEQPDEGLDDEDEIRIAVIGRPNIGKSTLVNRLLGEERHVVHDAPGTTMDAIDSVIEVDGQRYRLVDTAGVRKKSKIHDPLETWASLRAIRTIERCHVSLLVVDGEMGPANQDARLAALVADRGRACVVLVNRWDLVREDPERGARNIRDERARVLPHLSWAPELYISALTGKGCHRILPLVDKVYEQFNKRITTSPLNDFLRAVVDAYQPPQLFHHPVRLNYMTQTRVRPPTFAIWVNNPEGIKPPYKRYLENRLREAYGFEGTPIRLHIKRKRRPGEPKAGEQG